MITITGLQLGTIIAFAIITETVFQWPGVGLLFINAVQFVDIPVMAAYLMMISVMFVTINLIVDLLYFAIDPRLRVDGDAWKRTEMADDDAPHHPTDRPSTLRRFWESDLMWSFRHMRRWPSSLSWWRRHSWCSRPCSRR